MESSLPSSSLPGEIYSTIFTHCPLSTLFTIATCSQVFYDLSIRELYRDVKLRGTKQIFEFCKAINGSDQSENTSGDHGRYVRFLLVSRSEWEDWYDLDSSDSLSSDDTDTALLEDKVFQKRTMAVESLFPAIFRMPNLKRFTFGGTFNPLSHELFSALKTRLHLLELSVNLFDEPYRKPVLPLFNGDFAIQFFGLVKARATTLSKLTIVVSPSWSVEQFNVDLGHLFCGSSNSLPIVLPVLRELKLIKCSIWLISSDKDDLVRDMGPFLALNPQLKVLTLSAMDSLVDTRPDLGLFPITRNPSILPNGGKGLPEPPFTWPEFESLTAPLEQLITLLETPQPKLRRITQVQESIPSVQTNQQWDMFFRSLLQRCRNDSDLKKKGVRVAVEVTPIAPIVKATLRANSDIICESWIGKVAASLQGVQDLAFIPVLYQLDDPRFRAQTVKPYIELLKPLSTISSLLHLQVWFPCRMMGGDEGEPDKEETFREAIAQMIPSIPSSRNVTLGFED